MKYLALLVSILCFSNFAFSLEPPFKNKPHQIIANANLLNYTYEQIKNADMYFFNLNGINPGSDFDAVFKYDGECIQLFQKLINFLTPYYEGAYDGFYGWGSSCYPISGLKQKHAHMQTAMYIYTIDETRKKKMAASYKKLVPKEEEPPKFLERVIPLRKVTSSEITYSLTYVKDDKYHEVEVKTKTHNIPMAFYWLAKFRKVNSSPDKKEDLRQLIPLVFSEESANTIINNWDKFDQLNIWTRFILKHDNWYASTQYSSGYPNAMVTIKTK